MKARIPCTSHLILYVIAHLAFTVKVDWLKMNKIDVVIIGSGIAGLTTAYYLQKNFPNLTYVIIEARSDLGGTWDQMKFPGVRSDTDMYNYGFTFNPWQGSIVAQGSDIKAYLTDTAKKFNIKEVEDHIGRKLKKGESIYQVSPFKETDLNKLAFWNATGSGKTRTAAAMVDMFTKCNWAKRILFRFMPPMKMGFGCKTIQR